MNISFGLVLVMTIYLGFRLFQNKDSLNTISNSFKRSIKEFMFFLAPLIVFDIVCNFLGLEQISPESKYWIPRTVIVLISGISSMIGFFYYFVNFEKETVKFPVWQLSLFYFAIRTSGFVIPFYLVYIK